MDKSLSVRWTKLNMLIRAEQRYLRTSAKKIRFVAQTIRKVKSPVQAIAYLELTQKRPAEYIAKAIKQAVGNARNTYGIDAQDLIIKELLVNEGPSYKRGQPVSRGMFHPILKETSHIRVTLESVDKPKAVTKKVDAKKEEKVEIKAETKVAAKKKIVAKRKVTTKK
jgi:large subunit ribosomal protein L22